MPMTIVVAKSVNGGASCTMLSSRRRPSAGWTNETLLVTLRDRNGHDRRVVVRLPPAVPTWPVYDLAAQARVVTVRWDPDRRTPIPFTELERAQLTAVMAAAEA